MLGLEGTAVPLGIILTLLSALLCVIYGVINWNRGYVTEEELAQESVWTKEEEKVQESL